MRLVRVRDTDVPADWLKRAQALREQLVLCADDPPNVAKPKSAAQKRKKLIDANQKVWTELKETLLEWSHRKCWYSELKDPGSDMHVDHFRPKGRVRNPGEPDREGYWWLAFSWENYRISVAWCNSPHKGKSKKAPAKGKHDQFPLGKNGVIATSPDEDLDAEDVVLLDPVDPDDVLLLDFDESGLPVPTADGWSAERVAKTVDVLHLDAPRMKEARQRLWRRCQRLLDEANELVNQPDGERSVKDKTMLKRRLRDIRDLLAPEAELSAVARACVKRSAHPWALSILAA